MKENEKLLNDEKVLLRNFVNYFTTVSTNEDVVGEDVSQIVCEVNKHLHTKACRKHGTQCRFNFPKYPSTKTIIGEPICGLNDKEKKEKLKSYKEILMKVGDILNDEATIKSIIEDKGTSEREHKDVY